MFTLEQARGWYPHRDGVHGFDHIERVYHLCEKIGPAEGAQMDILLTAALMHDASGSHPVNGNRSGHHIQSAQFARKKLGGSGWAEEMIQAVEHCIRAHRYRKGERAESTEAKVLFDADKLDVIGAIGVTRALAYAFQVGTPAYVQPSKQFLQTWEKTEGEPHSAYHEYLFKLSKIEEILFTATAKNLAAHRQEFLNGFFEELADEMNNKK
jgi:uncharacterized protein